MEAPKGRGGVKTQQHRNLQEVMNERRSQVQADVKLARALVEDYECKRRVRQISAKFNTVQEELTKKASAR